MLERESLPFIASPQAKTSSYAPGDKCFKVEVARKILVQLCGDFLLREEIEHMHYDLCHNSRHLNDVSDNGHAVF